MTWREVFSRDRMARETLDLYKQAISAALERTDITEVIPTA